MMARRCLKEKNARINIRKEINKRFKFGNRQNNDNFGNAANSNNDNEMAAPTRQSEEEAKISSDHMGSNDSSSLLPNEQKKSAYVKGIKFLGSTMETIKEGASNLANKVNLSKPVIRATEDPTHYEALNEEGAKPDRDQINGQHTRVWASDGPTNIVVSKEAILNSVPGTGSGNNSTCSS